ncbi:MAG TPA: helix-turn-helix transcriptional regulator [Pseudonocardiaceae bacterium]|nr:helix-turn-helix transcriptional regulator [Pseudonocardiaceae bacterium]
MRDAFSSHDMGTILRAYRYHPAHGHKALPQETVSRWLGTVTQSQLSRIESGRNRVDTLDKLIHYARALKMPADLLWFEMPDEKSEAPKHSRDVFALPDGPLVAATSLRAEPALADTLLGALDLYTSMDNLAGPQSLVDVAPRQLRFVENLLSSARGRDRNQFLYVGARYAEFAGWVYQDTGDLNSAMQMSSVALDFAQEADDETLISYILMRRSNIATDAKRPQLALKLADAALDKAKRLSPRYYAVALRQRAHAFAQLGQPDDCARTLELAFKCADQSVESEKDLAQYCTLEYVEMEAAHCWIELGQADKAISILQRSLAGWKPEHRRDLGLCLARLAVAHASNDQIANAVIVAERSLDIASETKSARTRDQLAQISGILIARGARDEAQRFDRKIRSLKS